jgi:hypothetical protein
MAGRPSRNLSLPDKFCRRLITRATAVALKHGFLRDKLVDNNEGFEPGELDRYQRELALGANPECAC